MSFADVRGAQHPGTVGHRDDLRAVGRVLIYFAALAGDGPRPASWLGREVFGVSQTPQVLLDHFVYDEAGRLRIAWDTVDGSLDPVVAEGMLAAHLKLRRLAVEDSAWTDPSLGWDPAFLPDIPLTASPFDNAGPLLDDPARAAARRHGVAPAIVSSEGTLSHGELDDRATSIGALLVGIGVAPGDLVAVAAEKAADQVAALRG